MNFFRLIFLVLIVVTFSQKVMSDSHDQNIVEKAKEINKQVKEKQASQQEIIKKETGQIVVQEEPLPLNDPFAGDASTVGCSGSPGVSTGAVIAVGVIVA